MPNHKDAAKRARQAIGRRVRNRQYRSMMRTQIKKTRATAAGKDVAAAREELNKAVSIIQRLAARGIIHRNQAARRVSRLYKAFNARHGQTG